MTQTYIRKQEKSQINHLTLHLVELEKEEQTKHKIKEGKKSYLSEQKQMK